MAKKNNDDFTSSDILEKEPVVIDPVKEVKKVMADDPIAKYIPVIMKYAPIVIGAIKGFTDKMQDNKQRQMQMQMQQAPQQPQILPPANWDNLSELQRYSKKHSEPQWFAQGEHYEKFKISGVPPPQQQVYQQPMQPPVYAQPVNPPPPVQYQPTPQMESLNNESVATIQQVPAQTPTQEPLQNEEREKVQEMTQALQKDNEQYLKFAVDYLNNLNMDDFEDYVDDTGMLAQKFKTFQMLIPTQTKLMIQKISPEDFENIIKEGCKVKYKWLKDNGKTNSLKLIFEQVRKVME